MSTKLPAGSPDYPDELAQLPHGRHGLPPEFVARNQRERLIVSFTALVAEVGYNEATIGAITDGAGVSSRTWYKYFRSIDDCYAAALDAAFNRLGVLLLHAFESEPDWPLGVRAAVSAMLAYLADEPALARLLTAEPFVAGSAIAGRHKAAIELAVPYLRAGRELRADAEPLPETTERGLLGALSGLIARKETTEGAPRLTELFPDLVQFLLTPYLGAAEARRIATLS